MRMRARAGAPRQMPKAAGAKAAERRNVRRYICDLAMVSCSSTGCRRGVRFGLFWGGGSPGPGARGSAVSMNVVPLVRLLAIKMAINIPRIPEARNLRRVRIALSRGRRLRRRRSIALTFLHRLCSLAVFASVGGTYLFRLHLVGLAFRRSFSASEPLPYCRGSGGLGR